MRDARKSMQDIQYDWDTAVLRRAKLVIRHKRLVDKIRDAHVASIEAKIRLIEATSDVQGLKDRNGSIMERLEQERKNLQQAVEEVNRAREVGKQLGEDVKDLLAREPDKRDLFTQLCDGKIPHEVEMEIAAEEAQLELIHAANPNVIREFERRAEEIARLRRKMEGSNEKLAGLEGHLNELMAKWEPNLEELVSKINDAFAYNFEQISCAGEVRVHKDEDFSLWALDVMVKFRYVLQQISTTPLQPCKPGLGGCSLVCTLD